MPQLTRRRYPERPDCWHVYLAEWFKALVLKYDGVRIDRYRVVMSTCDDVQYRLVMPCIAVFGSKLGSNERRPSP
jgi:hypothetical protein